MDNRQWTLAARRIDAATALRDIRQQHELIRSLLGDASATAKAAVEGDLPLSAAVASFDRLRRVFLIHLAFEEGALVPILLDDLPLGPDRAERLIEEHVKQRRILEALSFEATCRPYLPALATQLAMLADAMLADMLEEEECLLTPDVVRDDQVVIDQTCG